MVSSWQVRPKKKLPASTSSSSSPLSTSSSSPHNQNQCWTAHGHNMVIIKYINIVLIIINILIRRSHNPQHGDDDHYHQHQDGCNWCTHPQRQSQSSLSASSSPVNKNQYFIFYLGIIRYVLREKKRYYLGIFPKRRAPPPTHPFWEPLIQKKILVFILHFRP